MRLALIWVAATTVSLVGCFSPSINAGDQCTAEGDCPGSLNCNAGFCCEGTDLCGTPIDDDGGPIDAGPDADLRAFTDHLAPFTCDSNTEFLLQFDSIPFNNSPSCGAFQVDGRAAEVDTPSRTDFGMAVSLDPDDVAKTQFVETNVAALPLSVAGYTIEAWFEVERPLLGETSIIASAFSAVPGGAINNGVFTIGLTSNGSLKIEVFNAQCTELDPRGFTTTVQVPRDDGEMHHVRMTVSETTLHVYLDAVLIETLDLETFPLCMNLRAAELRVGAVEVQDEFEFENRRAAKGRIDDVRYSDIVR